MVVSEVAIADIGEGDDGALLCFTDLIQCCRGDDTSIATAPLGEWFFPNGSAVPISSAGGDFYRTRGPSVVRLHCRNNATSPIGQFCCEVPDATSINMSVCANIGELQMLPPKSPECVSILVATRGNTACVSMQKLSVSFSYHFKPL